MPDLDPSPRRRRVTGAARKLYAHQHATPTAWLWERPGPAVRAVGPQAVRLQYADALG